jgi:GntR family transcriptional regulator, rspAB operon transcriptional repressor
MDTPRDQTADKAEAREPLPYEFLHPLSRRGRGGTMQRVQDAIREAIVSLAFTPGEFIHKEAICKRLGVSRFPVSEALGRLADEGFVEVLPQRGTRVSRIDIPSCRQAMFIRRALEGEATWVVAQRASDQLIARLDLNLAEQKQAMERADGLQFAQLDIVFHDLLLSELGHERVKAVVDAARGSLDRTRLFLLRTPVRQNQSFLEHVTIVDAVKARNADAARQAIMQHLDRVLAELERRAAENPDVFAPSPGPLSG